MDLNKLRKDFEEAEKLLHLLKDRSSAKEADILMNWILNREDLNPYSLFVETGMAAACGSIQGLASIYYDLHHALHDDGAICFVAINDEPRIIMAHPSDYEDDEDFLEMVEKLDLNGRSRHIHIPSIAILNISVSEFIKRRDESDRNHLKRCVMLEARKRGKAFAESLYKDRAFFDITWLEN